MMSLWAVTYLSYLPTVMMTSPSRSISWAHKSPIPWHCRHGSWPHAHNDATADLHGLLRCRSVARAVAKTTTGSLSADYGPPLSHRSTVATSSGLWLLGCIHYMTVYETIIYNSPPHLLSEKGLYTVIMSFCLSVDATAWDLTYNRQRAPLLAMMQQYHARGDDT